MVVCAVVSIITILIYRKLELVGFVQQRNTLPSPYAKMSKYRLYLTFFPMKSS